MESESFGQENPMDDEQLNMLARLYMLRHFPGNISVGLSERENNTLDAFLANATDDEIEKVSTRGKWLQKYFVYTDESSSDDEKTAIEQEMENDSGLREYIEKTQLYALTERYLMWKDGVERSSTHPDERIYEMSEEDILTFFTLLEVYPDIVDEALGFMTSEIHPGPHTNSKYVMKENETQFKSERERLVELNDYFTGKMTSDERSNFHDEIIDNPAFQSMFTKIQNALR